MKWTHLGLKPLKLWAKNAHSLFKYFLYQAFVPGMMLTNTKSHGGDVPALFMFISFWLLFWFARVTTGVDATDKCNTVSVSGTFSTLWASANQGFSPREDCTVQNSLNSTLAHLLADLYFLSRHQLSNSEKLPGQDFEVWTTASVLF